MSLVVIGSLALDSVETPTEKRDDILGGSASYFTYAASYFTPVRLVSVVGDDWPEEHTKLLESRDIDMTGLEIREGAKTFRWGGRYSQDMNDRVSLYTDLNVFSEFDPVLPEEYKRSGFVFLANGPPFVQRRVLEQCGGAKLSVADTMDCWIKNTPDELRDLMKQVDGLVLNDSEAKLLAEEDNLVLAGRKICEMGPRFIVLKKGEHGAMFFSKHEMYVLPAYPTAQVVDPTGAGDSFGGGMMGYLASQDRFDAETLKTALAYGILTASFTVEGFSLDKLKEIEREDIDARLEEYRRMLKF